MISLGNITKEYCNGSQSLIALNEINLSIYDSDFIAIMGPSGSGKTTLLNIIGCMDNATSGEYFYDNQPIHKYSQHKKDLFRKENISFIFQNFALLKDYTVRENIEIPLRARNISRRKRKEKVHEILKKVGMSECIDSLPTKLSGGQQQRVAIARALIAETNLILADEPTGALDSKTGQEILDLLCELNEKYEKTIIIVTHDEKIAARAKRIIHINDGCISEFL